MRGMGDSDGFSIVLLGQHDGLNSQWTASHTDQRPTREARGPEPLAKCVIFVMRDTL